MSDIATGVNRINAGDRIRLASILGKSVLFFFSGVQQSDLTGREQKLRRLVRALDDNLQESLLANVRNQLALFNQTKAIESLPVDKRGEAAYELVSRLFDVQGLDFTTDDEGRPVVDEGELAAVLRVKDPSKAYTCKSS